MADNLIISNVIKYQGYYYDEKKFLLSKRSKELQTFCPFVLLSLLDFLNAYADTIFIKFYEML